MNLKELGGTFRLERERKGMSVEDVVQRTKISKSNIVALEAGDAEGLPHPVYAKGFVRNYARLLGLDPEECATIMAQEFVAQDNVSSSQPEADVSEKEYAEDEKGKSGALVFVIGVLAIALVAGGMFFLTPAKEQPAAPEQETVEVPEVQQQTAPAQIESAEQAEPEAQATPAEPSVEETGDAIPEAPGSEAAPADSPAQLEPEGAVEEQSAVGSEPAQAQGGAADGRQRVVVTAREACWIFAEVDGGDSVEGGVTVDVVLQPGQSKQLRYHKEMIVKLGNAGGVDVTLNGKDYSYEAQSGQVKTLTFKAP